MLQPRNLAKVLSGIVEPECASTNDGDCSSIISSILVTPSGQPVSSYHINRRPPPPHTIAPSILSDDVETTPHLGPTVGHKVDDLFKSSTPNDSSTSSLSGKALDDSHPYEISRSMKTNVYSLFASSAWQEYQKAGMGNISLGSGSEESEHNKSSSQNDWLCFNTEDCTQILISPVILHSSSSQLLLVLVADEGYPLGLMLKKCRETTAILEKGLDTYRVYD